MNKSQEQEAIEAEQAIKEEVKEAVEYNKLHHLGKIALQGDKLDDTKTTS